MNPNPKAPNPYLKTRVMSATPEELRLMLYEGAIRFARQARQAMEKGDHEATYTNLSRAQKIVLELSTSLDHSVMPDLCERLSALYTYVYRRMVDANMEHDVTAIDEAVELLEFETETWRMLMSRLDDHDAPGRPAPQAPAPQPRQIHPLTMPRAPINSLSIRG